MRRGRCSRRYRRVGVFYIFPPGIYPMTTLRLMAGNKRIIVSDRQ